MFASSSYNKTSNFYTFFHQPKESNASKVSKVSKRSSPVAQAAASLEPQSLTQRPSSNAARPAPQSTMVDGLVNYLMHSHSTLQNGQLTMQFQSAQTDQMRVAAQSGQQLNNDVLQQANDAVAKFSAQTQGASNQYFNASNFKKPDIF